MRKYRFCSGLALFPDKDMKMLHEMSLQGWHLTGMSELRYRFEQGEPHSYIYAVNYEEDVTEEMISLYKESGWEIVMCETGCQICRAEEGTAPIFSDTESHIEVIAKQRKLCGKVASMSLLVVAVSVIWIAWRKDDSFFIWLLMMLGVMMTIFSGFPFIGFTAIMNKLRKEQN